MAMQVANAHWQRRLLSASNVLAVCWCCLSTSGTSNAADAVPAASDTIDFDTQIMPVFSVYGCNAASCHGASTGQAGFHLSLFGGDPAHDFRAIVRELEGRRVDLHRAAQSLVLMKATGELEHGGDQRFTPESPAARLIQLWIEQGAPRTQNRHLTRLEVAPDSVTVTQPMQIAPFKVIAHFANGSTADVSTWSTQWTTDDVALQRQSDGSYLLTRPGRHWVFVRYLSHIFTVPITAPVGSVPTNASQPSASNWIDELVNQTLNQLQLQSGELADDATFGRRVYLDLTGRLPTLVELTKFLDDESDAKRNTLIEQLISSESFVDYWTYQIATWLRLSLLSKDRPAADALHGWLRLQIANDRPWDELVGELLLATGNSHEYGPAAFHRMFPNARAEAEYVSEVMLGVRLRCANCHNHPLDRWTQDDYHGLAQIFASFDRGTVVSRNRADVLTHPRTGAPVVAQIPGQSMPPEEHVGVEQLTTWLTSADNPYFARAFAGRVWRSLMGRALIDPVDDSRATNPPSDPALLGALTRFLTDHDFRLRPFVRAICQSSAYQRAAAPPQANPELLRYYAFANRRPLAAEVLADAITDVTGVSDYSVPDVRAITQVEPGAAEHTLRVLGRCDVTTGCVPESEQRVMDIAMRLDLINGAVLNARITADNGRARMSLRNQDSEESIVESFYMLALSRRPRDDERRFWLGELRQSVDAIDRQQRVEDFLWSLLNCQDFVTNH